MAESQSIRLASRWSFYGCTSEDEQRVAACWREKGSLLADKAVSLADQPLSLSLVADGNGDGPARWTVRGALPAWGGLITSEGSGETTEGAIDALLAQFCEKIDRRLSEPPTQGARQADLDAVTATLTEWRLQERSAAFISFMWPLVTTLGPYIRRELRLRRAQGESADASLSTYEVLDEVLLRTWEEFPRRTANQPLHHWLIRLADESIVWLNRPFAEASTDDEVPVPSTDLASVDPDDWIERIDYHERIELGQLIPSADDILDWDEDRLEIKQQHLAELFGEMPWEQRQALILQVTQGFSTAEIADFQGRSLAEVETDIATSITELRRKLEQPLLADVEESFERQERRQWRKRNSARR